MTEKSAQGMFLSQCDKLRELNQKMMQGTPMIDIAKYLYDKDEYIQNRYAGKSKKDAIAALAAAISYYRKTLFSKDSTTPKLATDAFRQRYGEKMDYIAMLNNNLALMQERVQMRHSIDRKTGIPSRGVADDLKAIADIMEKSVLLQKDLGLLDSNPDVHHHVVYDKEIYDQLGRELKKISDPGAALDKIIGIKSLAPNHKRGRSEVDES